MVEKNIIKLRLKPCSEAVIGIKKGNEVKILKWSKFPNSKVVTPNQN